MSKEEKKKFVPKLRFPEFRESGEWKQAMLCSSDVASFVNEKSSEKLAVENYVSTENILPEYAGLTSASRMPPSAGNLTAFRIGDILLSNIRPYLKKVWFATKNGTASNDVIVIRPRPSMAGLFLSHLLKNDAFINYIMKGAEGVKMPRGDKDLIKEYPTCFPSQKEQQKIADCLSSLDELMAAHSSKLEALKAHKKGLMQALFPAEGETVPKLRFPEFRESGEWEEKMLGEMTSKVGSGVTPLGGETNYKKEGRPFVRSQNVGWGNFLLDDIVFIDEKTHANSVATELRMNDVLLNITGASIGRSAVVDENVDGGNVNQHVCIIRTTENFLSPFFLNQYLISNYGQKQIDSFQAGGNRQGLNFAQIRSFIIPCPPSMKEQQKIANTLSSLDAFITAQTEKLEALKLHKRGLMQGLFPATANTNETA